MIRVTSTVYRLRRTFELRTREGVMRLGFDMIYKPHTHQHFETILSCHVAERNGSEAQISLEGLGRARSRRI